MTINKRDILYPIANLKGERLRIFIQSLRSINRVFFNIKIIDTGKAPTTINPKLYDEYKHKVNDEQLFNKALTINLGVKELVKSDIFIVCDADVIFLSDMKELWKEKIHSFYLGRPSILVEIDNKYEVEHSFGAGKCFVINQKTFKMLGGLDEYYKGYGFEDTDFSAKYYLLVKKPYSLLKTLAIHNHYKPENNLDTNLNTSHYDRNRNYYIDKFNKYSDFLLDIHNEIRKRK